MLLLSWQLTIITVMLFSLLSVASSLLGGVREASFEKSKASRWFTSVSLEFISGIRTVQAFAAQDFERSRFVTRMKLPKLLTNLEESRHQ